MSGASISLVPSFFLSFDQTVLMDGGLNDRNQEGTRETVGSEAEAPLAERSAKLRLAKKIIFLAPPQVEGCSYTS